MNEIKYKILKSAKDEFHNISKIVEIDELNVELGWFEIHTCRSVRYSLHEFLISSLRNVKFWMYNDDDEVEFEQDIKRGIFELINRMEFEQILKQIQIVYSKELYSKIKSAISLEPNSNTAYKYLLIYNEWNNTAITIISNNEYKTIYFGHSE